MSGDVNATEGARAEIRAFWERVGAQYDDRAEHGVFSEAEHALWTTALSALPAGARVLDIGTGTGFLAVLLANLGYRVTAVDASTEMLAHARAKAAEHGLGIAFEQAETEALPFPNASFDALTSRHVIWTLLEPDQVFTEWRRVLVPGGMLVADCSLDPEVAGHHYSNDVVNALPFRALNAPDPVVDALRSAEFIDVKAELTKTSEYPRAMLRARARTSR